MEKRVAALKESGRVFGISEFQKVDSFVYSSLSILLEDTKVKKYITLHGLLEDVVEEAERVLEGTIEERVESKLNLLNEKDLVLWGRNQVESLEISKPRVVVNFSSGASTYFELEEFLDGEFTTYTED